MPFVPYCKWVSFRLTCLTKDKNAGVHQFSIRLFQLPPLMEGIKVFLKTRSQYGQGW